MTDPRQTFIGRRRFWVIVAVGMAVLVAGGFLRVQVQRVRNTALRLTDQ